MFSVITVIAQETTKEENTPVNFNELKVNGLYLVFGALEVTFELTLTEESGVGVSLFVPIDEEINEDINFYISPYYRIYFGDKYASGFFVEGFCLLSSIKRYETSFLTGPDPIFVTEEKNTTDFALGIGLGGKWVTSSSFIGELNGGIGRNLFNGNENGDDLVGKIGVTVGYGF
ncbi:MAG: DUF3575 domain-containing protein [Lacinutrix sp.]|uniref:DUF3575 domain-containing protein n=1 Tax=Lacinutrix sp. TaxID=1937692 RepID=UPI00309F5B4A